MAEMEPGLFLCQTGRIGQHGMTWNEVKKNLYIKNIFPYWSWNDLLRYRRVCKEAKELADEYIKINGAKRCPEITIYETGSNRDKTLSRFLELGFPTTCIYLMNTSGCQIFDKEKDNFANFLNEYGSTVTHFRIHSLLSKPDAKERAFFQGLPSLECLVVDKFDPPGRTDQEVLRRMNELQNVEYPEQFKKLKKLTVGVELNTPSKNVIVTSRNLMQYCEQLEFSADAYSSFIYGRGSMLNSKQILGLTFIMIKEYIEERSLKFPNKPNLKFYDFISFYNDLPAGHQYNEFVSSPKFLDLATVCVEHSVKLLNVNAAWFQQWQPQRILEIAVVTPEQLDTHTISTPVVSMVNLHGMVVPMDMPNLEKLTILAVSRCSLLSYGVSKQDRRPWPALKVLDVTVDAKMMYPTIASYDYEKDCATGIPPETTASLLKFLFVGIQRPAVREVSLTFADGMDVDDRTMNAAAFLGSCCSNMRKLTLVNWPGANASLINIFADVKDLEELCLEKCKKIGNGAFKKTDTTDCRLMIPKLKKLSLKGLDKMPKCTDDLFKNVICHMKLTHLILSSDRPLTHITPYGIRALKDGEFANSIENFPFHGWSLAKFAEAKFKQLEKEFRSFDLM